MAAQGGGGCGHAVEPAPGREVQVVPIELTLKAPGAEPSKPKSDELLSNFAFNFNLRRYNRVVDNAGAAERNRDFKARLTPTKK